MGGDGVPAPEPEAQPHLGHAQAAVAAVALRMAAVAAIVLMLAQPRLQNTLAGLLGGSKTHHIVLLDDSYSMSDKWADTDAFTQAKNVIARLGNQLSRQGGRQEFTLLLYLAGRAAAEMA